MYWDAVVLSFKICSSFRQSNIYISKSRGGPLLGSNFKRFIEDTYIRPTPLRNTWKDSIHFRHAIAAKLISPAHL